MKLRLHAALLWCLVFSIGALGQTFKPSLNTNFGNIYFYKINNKQAFSLFMHPEVTPDTSYFNHLAYLQTALSDTTPSQQGNYVKLAFKDNKLLYEYFPITSWRIFIQNPYSNSLNVQIQDLKTGKPITVSNIYYGHNHLKYDSKTQTYAAKNCGDKDILSITDKQETFYYTISREDHFSSFQQEKYNAILGKRPLKYFAGLYRMYNRCFIDAIQLFKHNFNRQSSFNIPKTLVSDFRDVVEGVHNDKNYYTYIYFSKPKYKEKDTIKFKAHILQNFKKGKWYNKPVKVFIEDYHNAIYLGNTYSKKKGAGYDFQFVIQDSMDLSLDEDYEIVLRDLDSSKLGSDKFTYEDYELKKSVFKIELADGNNQFKGKPFKILFTAKDENGLSMADTRITVNVTTRDVHDIQPNYLFVPDTLWTFTRRIRNIQDSLLIPDSIFPNANVDYRLDVVMQNDENERTDLDQWVTYHLEEYNIKMIMEDSGIHITTLPDNEKKIHLTAEDRFEFTILDTTLSTPCTIPLNSHALIYYADMASNHDKLDMDQLPSGVDINGRRNRDSVFFSVNNPKRLPFVYYINSKRGIIRKGTNHDFPLAFATDDESGYYLMVQYIWAGKTQNSNIFVPALKNTVKFNIEKPNVITPGKDVAFKITATDYKNKPIKDLNLLAYGYTQKFGESEIAPLPYSNVISKNTYGSNAFEIAHENDANSTILSYYFWNKRLILDTNWAYHFRYPSKKQLESTLIKTTDSITQIAPFVMENGVPQPIQYVFIDNIPVYFGFTTKKTAYSFQVDTNPHQLIIRTSHRLLTIDSFKAVPFVKNLFSIDPENVPSSVEELTMPLLFTEQERSKLAPFIMSLNMPAYCYNYAYLERSQDNGQYIDLTTNNPYYRSKDFSCTVGPIHWRYWYFNSFNNFRCGFDYEPGYTYSFEENLVKMKSNEADALKQINFGNEIPDINDVVLTKELLFKNYKAAINEGHRNTYPRLSGQILSGNSRLAISYDESLNNFKPANIILGKPGNFNLLNIYPGKSTEFTNLPAGKYQLLLIDSSNKYRLSNIIEVKKNGRNFYRITNADSLKENNSGRINQAVSHLYQFSNQELDKDLHIIMNEYTNITYEGQSVPFSGIVLDDEDNPIANAEVRITNTQIGSTTDKKGAFTMNIPSIVEQNLTITAQGWTTEALPASKNMLIKMRKSNLLDEVVITTPYAPPTTKEKYVGAADVVTSRTVSKMSITDLVAATDTTIGDQATNGNGMPGSGANIQIRGRESLNAATFPLIVVDGAPFDGDISTIDPSIIASMNVLKDATATGLYGSRGANGVIIITIKKGVTLPENIKKALQETPMLPDMLVSGMRHNFKDDAYWQPDLVTDENGKTSFKVTFPDDITNWQTIVIGVDDKLHTGQAFGNIKSYKPIAASLYLPHFLLDGDTAILVGKSVNYIPDTIPVTTTFYQDDSLKMEHKLKLGAYYSDTLLATAHGSDSVKLKYLLTKEDGYFDGEERTIPLERVGVKVAEGGFQALDMKDTSFTIYPTKRSDTLHIAATASLVDVVLDEIEVVRDYGYLCNEQMASKILALLSKQKMYALLHKDFSQKDKDYINQLLGKISKNQNNNHLWGWWENGGTVNWISNHVLHAIMESKAQGYSCNIDLKPITDAYIFDLERDTVYTNISMLQTLAESGLTLNFEKYISRLERNKKLPFNDYLDLVLLRQKLHLPYKLDRLNNLKEEDIFGNIYWKDTAQFVYSNEMLTTVKALKIIQKDSGNSIHKNKIINWLLQQRGSHGWRNTYESVQIIEAIAPYILYDTAALKPVLKLNGGVQEEITVFPYQKAMPLSTPLMIRKTGIAPVYFTWYYNKWDTSNTNLGKSFKIKSHFEAKQKTIDYLPAGEPVTMKVNVQVDKSAEYIMLEIPIPAGCSYQSKPQAYYNHEIHREYFENKVSIFCDALPKGNYTFDVELLPRFRGTYTLNPAKAELMYFPVFYGREIIKKVEIKP